MSSEINKAFVQQFSGNLLHLINQEGSMLMGRVRMEQLTGKYFNFDRIGRGTVVKRVSRHSDTPINDTAHSRRRVVLEDYEWGDLIDNQDKLRMLVDPTSDYAQAAAWDLGIQIDKILIEAINGNSESISASDAVTNVALPSTQIVDEDFGTGTNSDLTVEKLIEAKRLLLQHSGMMMGDATICVNASALAALLNIDKATSSDFNTVKALVQGELDSYVGFRFVTVKDGLLPGTADGTDTSPIKCLAFLQRSVGLATAQNINVRIAERADKAFATQVYASMSMGATRIEEEGVVAIECVQSA